MEEYSCIMSKVRLKVQPISWTAVFMMMTKHFNNNNNNNNNIQFLETHNTIKNSLYACEKSKYQTEIMIFQN